MSSSRPVPGLVRGARRRALALATAGIALALATTLVQTSQPAQARDGARESAAPAATGGVNWLCWPRRADPCSIPLTTTIRTSGKPDKVRTPARPRPAKRPVDCFYVYPTVTNTWEPNAGATAEPQVEAIARYQAARFSSQCRMIAPVYRQISVTGGLFAAMTAETAYEDVRRAWSRYIARVKPSRGFVLIGHSQGTMMLRRLIREEIETRPEIRERLVGALLIGGNVTTRRGSTTGGDFREVPLCTRRAQAGCVVAYSSYATNPPWISTFGNVRTDITSAAINRVPGLNEEVACVDPAVVAGTKGAFSIVIPSGRFPGGGVQWSLERALPGGEPSAATTWVRLPEKYVGTCRTINGANVLKYAPRAGFEAPREIIPGTGTHLIDMNLGLDRLVRVVELQAASWLKAQR